MGTWRLEEGVRLDGRYEILEIIGRGGMGVVYLAHDARLDIAVAVKEMRPRAELKDQDRIAVLQFEREARMLAQLTHPNLPRVIDYFVQEGRCYLIMEFIDGSTIEHLLYGMTDKKIPVPCVVDWGIQLADVLAYLHAQNPPIVFRDMKPANIMVLDDGTVKLIDFGIARRFQFGATKDTQLYGSPGYSPPEQYGHTQTNPRSDIYALGATLHQLVSGRDPSHTPFKFPSLRSLDPTVPWDLDTLLMKCLEFEEADRIQSAETVRDRLIAVRDAPNIAAGPLTAPVPLSAGPAIPGGAVPKVPASTVPPRSRRGTGRRAPADGWAGRSRAFIDMLWESLRDVVTGGAIVDMGKGLVLVGWFIVFGFSIGASADALLVRYTSLRVAQFLITWPSGEVVRAASPAPVAPHAAAPGETVRAHKSRKAAHAGDRGGSGNTAGRHPARSDATNVAERHPAGTRVSFRADRRSEPGAMALRASRPGAPSPALFPIVSVCVATALVLMVGVLATVNRHDHRLPWARVLAALLCGLSVLLGCFVGMLMIEGAWRLLVP